MIFDKLKTIVFFAAFGLAGIADTYAAPSGAEIAAGNASVSYGNGSTVINQLTDRAVINWNSFSIGAGETVRFDQPGASSVVLNRVTGGLPSEIFGSVKSNGGVFIINPAGILIGNGAAVETGSFLIGSANISDSDFMNGRYKFSGGYEKVENRGSIIVSDEGFAALIGREAVNGGYISARLGSAVLASGEDFTLDFSESGLLSVRVDKASLDNYVKNSGLIESEGGLVILTAGAASDALIGAVNNEGVVRAASAVSEGGRVILVAEGGTVFNSGSADVSSAASRGGAIEISAENAIITGDIDASGVTAGGSVIIRGENSAVAEKSARITAKGVSERGGKIDFLSGGRAVFKEGALASVASVYGDGGEMEISASNSVEFRGVLDARSVYGTKGKLTVDPTDVIIMKNAPESRDDVTYIDTDLLNSQLSLSDVHISTVGTAGGGRGDITAAAGANSGIAGGNLTLSAAGDIVLSNDSISLTGGLTLRAGGSVVSSAGIAASYLDAAASGGSVNFENLLRIGSVSASAPGSVNLSSVGDMFVGSALGSSVFLASGGTLTGSDIKAGLVNSYAFGNMNISFISEKVSAVSSSGSLNLKNNSYGTVTADVLKTSGGDISYFQPGGQLMLSGIADAGSGSMNVENASGTIKAGYALISDPTKNVFLKGYSVYLTGDGIGEARIGSDFTSKVSASEVFLTNAGDIVVTGNINAPDTKYFLKSSEGGIYSAGNTITSSYLNASAVGNIELTAGVPLASLISSGGNIDALWIGNAEFEALSAAGEVFLNALSASKLTVKRAEAGRGLNFKTGDNAKIDIRGNGKGLIVAFNNGNASNISVSDDGDIRVNSLNMAGLDTMSLESARGNLYLPSNNIMAARFLTLRGASVNGGAAVKLSSQNVLLNISSGGDFVLNADKADVSGGSFGIMAPRGIEFVDLNNDRLALYGTSFDIFSGGAVRLFNKASAVYFNLSSGDFELASFDSSLIGSYISVASTGNIYGTGRISGGSVFLKADEIGLGGSVILTDAARAYLQATRPGGGPSIKIAVSDIFNGIKNYAFMGSGAAYMNGVPVNKTYYGKIMEMGDPSGFAPYELYDASLAFSGFTGGAGTHFRLDEENGYAVENRSEKMVKINEVIIIK